MTKLEMCKARIQKAINKVDWDAQKEFMDKPVVNDTMAYLIFGDDLSIENSDQELLEMFLLEL